MPFINLLPFGEGFAVFTQSPSNLQISNTTGTQATLTWAAAQVDPPQDISYYLKAGSSLIPVENLSYSLVSPEQYTSPTSFSIYAAAEDAISDYTNSVTFTYTIVSIPTNLLVNGASSVSSDSCVLTWEAATVSPMQSLSYRIYIDNILYTTTTTTSYTIPESIISTWTTTKTITIDALATDGTSSSISNSVSFTYELPITNLYLARSNGYNGYRTNADVIDNADLQVGRASSSDHYGVYFKFTEPKNWDAITSMKLHIYRTAGSAAGKADIGVPSVTWPDDDSGMAYTNIYQLSSSRYISETIAAASTWTTIDITSLMSLMKESAANGYIILSMISKGTYMKINACPTETNAPWIEVT